MCGPVFVHSFIIDPEGQLSKHERALLSLEIHTHMDHVTNDSLSMNEEPLQKSSVKKKKEASQIAHSFSYCGDDDGFA